MLYQIIYGCVANTFDEQTLCIIRVALSTHSKDCFDKLHLRYTAPLVDAIHLPFANHIYRFNTTQGSSGGIERLESHHRFGNALDISMVLLNHVIQILALP